MTCKLYAVCLVCVIRDIANVAYFFVACRSAKLLRESEQHMKDIVRVLEASRCHCRSLFTCLSLSRPLLQTFAIEVETPVHVAVPAEAYPARNTI